jgi:hypothetical protein
MTRNRRNRRWPVPICAPSNPPNSHIFSIAPLKLALSPIPFVPLQSYLSAMNSFHRRPPASPASLPRALTNNRINRTVPFIPAIPTLARPPQSINRIDRNTHNATPPATFRDKNFPTIHPNPIDRIDRSVRKATAPTAERVEINIAGVPAFRAARPWSAQRFYRSLQNLPFRGNAAALGRSSGRVNRHYFSKLAALPILPLSLASFSNGPNGTNREPLIGLIGTPKTPPRPPPSATRTFRQSTPTQLIG